jgi:hypothetical protein
MQADWQPSASRPSESDGTDQPVTEERNISRMTKTSKAQAKERGTWLSVWLIFIMVHGIVATILVLYLQQQEHTARFPWALPALLALSLADIVAGIAAWYWKKWGLALYAISTAVGIVVGLILTASQLIVFHDIIPLVILGYLVRDKLSFFD